MAVDVLGHIPNKDDVRAIVGAYLEVTQVCLVEAVAPNSIVQDLDGRVDRRNLFCPVRAQRNVASIREGVSESGDPDDPRPRNSRVFVVVSNASRIAMRWRVDPA